MMSHFRDSSEKHSDPDFNRSESLRKKSAWIKNNTISQTTIEPESLTPPSSIEGIKNISEGTDGVKASAEGGYDTIFGRDSAIIGLSLVEKQPELAKKIIISLAERQGTVDNSTSEENPGKILHEERKADYGKSKIRNAVGKIVEKAWSGQEEGEEKRRISYVSADSTPLFIKLVARYCKYHGDEILREGVVLKNGETVDLRRCVEDATLWIESKINSDGLVEIERRNKLQNPFGQTWKDSFNGMIRPDGSLVNITGRIIYPEIQTLSIDALDAAAEILPDSEGDIAAKRRTESSRIRSAVFDKMWSETDHYFVSGLEESADRSLAQIKTIESTAGRMLNSGLFDKLEEQSKQEYISAIVERLFSKEFLTDVGIRSRSLTHGDKMDNADYHGSYVSWPTDTFQVAEGLRRQGFPALAEQLENRILNAINMAGSAHEFFFVDENGKPILDYKNKTTGTSGTLAVTMIPEHNQGWTYSAAIEIKRKRGSRDGTTEYATLGTWQASLEQQVLKQIPNIQPYRSREEMADSYPTEVSDTKLDRLSGFARTGKYFAREVAKQVADAQKAKKQQ